jgi:eukaryotic-like serine/threonine-protein kinase
VDAIRVGVEQQLTKRRAMISNASGRLVLSEDVLIVPVTELPDESRKRIECKADDFAVSRTNSRNGSKIVDVDAANLLGRFRQQRSVVEAVILFAKEKRLEPEKVLEEAYPFLRNMIEGGFLVSSDEASGEPTGAEAIGVGVAIAAGTITRVIQVLEDTEVYLISKPDQSFSVLKLERVLPVDGHQARIAARFSHEGAFLNYLEGSLAPRLLGQGELDGRRYLEMEFIPGVDVVTATAQWREGQDARHKLLAIAQAITRTYAALHQRGVLHGDVHPSNVLITADGSVKLIDFGVAGPIGPESSLPTAADRGGVPFFFEPELARACLAGWHSAPPSQAGEQHAVAALIYLLMTGDHWQNFRFGREDMLEDIAQLQPLSFRERGGRPWPEMERILTRAMAKPPEERFPSMQAFADALGNVTLLPPPPPANPTPAAIGHLVDRVLAQAAPDGAWNQSLLSPAPTTSVNYGSAGVAVGLLHIGLRRRDPTLLTWADIWSRRAMREMANADAFYNDKIEITRETVGESSPYHSPAGVHAGAALVAAASADSVSQIDALNRFLQATERPAVGLDLTLGKSSILLGSAILLDALGSDSQVDTSGLQSLGNRIVSEVWRVLDGKPGIAGADIEYPGIAHGWAGFLYATLQWCKVSRSAVPPGIERRLEELAALAVPVHRGLDWPWVLGRSTEPASMPGWCNGACGYVFLWTLAHRLSGLPRYLQLAHGAAWRSWEAPDELPTLCCGLAGRAYALLNLYRYTNEKVWLERARGLAARGTRARAATAEYAHSLYKGEFGLAVLMADLEEPEESAMPFFEPLGYQD